MRELRTAPNETAATQPIHSRGWMAYFLQCCVLCDIYTDIYVCVSLKWRLELLLATGTAGDREPLPLDWWCDLA